MTLTSQTGHSPGHHVFSPQEARKLEMGLFSPVSVCSSRHHYSESEPRVKFPPNFMGLSTSESDGLPLNPPSFVVNGPEENSNLKIPPNFMTSGTESDQETESYTRTNSQLLASKFAKMGGMTYYEYKI